MFHTPLLYVRAYGSASLRSYIFRLMPRSIPTRNCLDQTYTSAVAVRRYLCEYPAFCLTYCYRMFTSPPLLRSASSEPAMLLLRFETRPFSFTPPDIGLDISWFLPAICLYISKQVRLGMQCLVLKRPLAS